MRRLQSLPTLWILPLVAALACDADPETSGTADRAADADAETNPTAGPPRPPGPPSIPVMIVHAADDTGSLDDAQREDVAAVLDTLRTSHEGGRASHDALASALAAGLEGCTFDETAITVAQADLVAAAALGGAADAVALDDLHAIFDADQRSEAVDELRSREPPPPPMRGLVRELGLDDDQIVQLADAVGEPDPQRTPPGDGIDALLEAFAADDFAAASFDLPASAHDRAQTNSDRLVELVEALCPIVDDEQRELLEARLQSSPPPPPPPKPPR